MSALSRNRAFLGWISWIASFIATQAGSAAAQGSGNGQFSFPTHLFLRGDRLYVNDTINFRLQVFDTNGRVISAFGGSGQRVGEFGSPAGRHISGDHIYVADSYNRRIQVFQFLGGR